MVEKVPETFLLLCYCWVIATGGADRRVVLCYYSGPFTVVRYYPRCICGHLVRLRMIDSCYVKFGSQGVTALYPIPRKRRVITRLDHCTFIDFCAVLQHILSVSLIGSYQTNRIL